MLETVDLSLWAHAVAEAYGDGQTEDRPPLTFTTEDAGWSFYFVLTHARLGPDNASIQSAHVSIFITAPRRD